MTSSAAQAMAQASGLPPNVLPWSPGLSTPSTSCLAQKAETGSTPPPSALPRMMPSGCVANAVTELGIDEVSDAGFSAGALLEEVTGSYEQDWTWSDGTVTPAALTLTARSGKARWYEAEAETGGAELAVSCDPQLEAPATLTLTTNDGQLNERWPVRLLAAKLNDVSVQQTEPISTLDGSFDLAEIEARLEIVVDSYAASFRISNGAASGSLAATAQSSAGSSPTRPTGTTTSRSRSGRNWT